MKQGLPKPGSLVLCTIKRIGQFAAWCDLDEYQNLEGMIHISEAAGKWVRDIKKFIKPNKQYVAKVVKIDESNTINLSLKRVSKSEEKKKWGDHRKGQRAEGMLKLIASEVGEELDKAYNEIGFKLQEEFGDLYAGFEEIKKDPKILSDLDIPKKWHAVLLDVVEKSFLEKEFTLKVELQVQSYESDGVERIKKVLEGLEKDGMDVAYISAPKYQIEVKTKNPKSDTRKFEQKIEKVTSEAIKLGVQIDYKFIE